MNIISIHDVFARYIEQRYEGKYEALTKNKHGRFGVIVEYVNEMNQFKVGSYQFEDENIWWSFDGEDEDEDE